MDQRAFDRLATLLGRAASRRAGLRAAFGVLLGQSALPGVAAARGDAGRNGSSRPEGPCGNGSRKDNACTSDGQCCTGFCDMKIAKRNADGKGRCRCVRKGRPCTAKTTCCQGACFNGTCSPGAAPSEPCSDTRRCAGSRASCTTYAGTSTTGDFCLLTTGTPCAFSAQCVSNSCIHGVCAPCSCPSCSLPCSPTVCPTCSHTTIQSAIGAATSGATIDIAPGTYVEDLTITQPLTLRACRPAGNADPVIIRNATAGFRSIAASSGAALDLIDITIEGVYDKVTPVWGGGLSTDGDLRLCASTTIRESGWDLGGGINLTANGRTLLVTDNATITGNYAQYGGGIRVVGESDIRIEGAALIANNLADSYGGGVLALTGANLTVAGRARIRSNQAAHGGGIDHRRGASSREYAIHITGDAVISGNRATTGDGGGIVAKIYNSFTYFPATLTIDGNAAITGNSAGYDGGGISNCAVPTIIGGNAVLSGNTAGASGIILEGCAIKPPAASGEAELGPQGGGGRGGAIWISGGVGGWPTGVTGLTIGGSAALRTNGALRAGAVFMDDTTALMTNQAEVSGNTASQEGGGFYLALENLTPSSLTLSEEATITGNTATSGGGVYSEGATNSLTAPSSSITGNTVDNCAGLGISC